MLPPPRTLLNQFGLRPKHSFGQNFLSDPGLLSKVASAVIGDVKPGPKTRILELGAGLGALTACLLEAGFLVTAIERDRDLIGPLGELFKEAIEEGRLVLVEDDAKTTDWLGLLGDAETKIIAGNLPYQLTGPLLEKTIRFPTQIAHAAFLVQREVADRLAAAAGTEDYGALSVFTQARFRIERAVSLGGGAFYPPPKVSSMLVRLVPRPDPIEETRVFQNLVKAAFRARRKTLRNAWKGLFPSDVMEEVAPKEGISLDARGETLTTEQFANLARRLASLERAP